MGNKIFEKGHRTEVTKKLMTDGWLKQMYLVNGLTVKKISDIVGCSGSSVCRAFIRLGIKAKKIRSKYPLLNDREWLKDCYINKKYSTIKIAKLAGCKNGSGIVYGILKDTLNIQMRKNIEAQKIRGLMGKREKSSNWKGGKIKSIQGYIYIYNPEHPLSSKVGYVAEHRLVAEKKYGRGLKKGEIVHHVNGKKDDNRPENLIIFNREDHKMTHLEILKELSELRIKLENYEKK